MPAGFEILESAENTSPSGSFVKKADQTKFRSAFGIVSGNMPPRSHYFDKQQLESGLISKDGRARLGFTVATDEKGKVLNTIFKEGATLQEFVVSIADAEAFERYAGALSEDRVAQFIAEKQASTEGGTKVALSSGGMQENITRLNQ